jgi:hypothetical protein
MNKIRNKRPRTPKGLDRLKRVTLNLTEPEYEIIKRNALKAGIPLGAFARLIALEGRVLARLEDGDRELLREVVRLSNDLHQLAMSACSAGGVEMSESFILARNAVDDLLNRVRL